MNRWFGLLALLALVACGGGDEGERQGCEPGSLASCTCDDGSVGSKTCKSSGSGYNDCACKPVDVRDVVGPEEGGGEDTASDGAGEDTDGAGEVACQPACAGKACGPDGCGGSCGACEAGTFCNEGACEATCASDAGCGPDVVRCTLNGGATQGCEQVAEGCWKWADPVACGAGLVCEEGTCVAYVCGTDDPPTPSGTISTSVASLSFDALTVALVHKRDVDPWEDGCVGSVEAVLTRGAGCRLTLRAGEAFDSEGRLRLFSATFEADSHCPGFPDTAEGVYQPVEGAFWGSLLLDPLVVPGSDVEEACLDASLSFTLGGELRAVGVEASLLLFQATLTATGEVLSVGSYDVPCPCQPDCTGKSCGDDGCGDSCGACPGAQDTCVDGACVCQPACGGKACGDDGCGDSCGACDEGYLCDAGQCVKDCTPKPVTPCEVVFTAPLTAPVPQEMVWLTGTFTDWAPDEVSGARPMALYEDPPGVTVGWRATATLPAGPYEYKFLMTWPDNPTTQWCVPAGAFAVDCAPGGPNALGTAACGTYDPCAP